MVDPETALISGAAVLGLGKVVQDFLKRVAGPAGDELGAWLREKVHAYRTKNVAAVAKRATEILAASGTAAREVPLRTLLPLLDSAANEDQVELQERWAALLARAAAGEVDSVGPFYVHILRQLTPFDAKVLTEVARIQSSRAKPNVPAPGPAPPLPWGVSAKELDTALEASDSERVEVSLTILRSLGLLETEPPVQRDAGGYAYLSDAGEVRLSVLGHRFLAACTPPLNGVRHAAG